MWIVHLKWYLQLSERLGWPAARNYVSQLSASRVTLARLPVDSDSKEWSQKRRKNTLEEDSTLQGQICLRTQVTLVLNSLINNSSHTFPVNFTLILKKKKSLVVFSMQESEEENDQQLYNCSVRLLYFLFLAVFVLLLCYRHCVEQKLYSIMVKEIFLCTIFLCKYRMFQCGHLCLIDKKWDLYMHNSLYTH